MKRSHAPPRPPLAPPPPRQITISPLPSPQDPVCKRKPPEPFPPPSETTERPLTPTRLHALFPDVPAVSKAFRALAALLLLATGKLFPCFVFLAISFSLFGTMCISTPPAPSLHALSCAGLSTPHLSACHPLLFRPLPRRLKPCAITALSACVRRHCGHRLHSSGDSNSVPPSSQKRDHHGALFSNAFDDSALPPCPCVHRNVEICMRPHHIGSMASQVAGTDH